MVNNTDVEFLSFYDPNGNYFLLILLENLYFFRSIQDINKLKYR